MDTSKGCLKIGGPKGCWIGCQTREGKGEGPEEPGERTFVQKWNGDTCGTETGKTGKHGRQDAVNSDSCKKAAYIYIIVTCDPTGKKHNRCIINDTLLILAIYLVQRPDDGLIN